jgi:hypothetical protein
MADEHNQPEIGTDQDLAALRHRKFGHLPARVHHDDLIETEEAKVPYEDPEDHLLQGEWGITQRGG